ncbi:Mut7-C RNAse domain-containing protein [Haloferax chudinovii]|uniref:Mut7-C RNAse domain-containing protein n=1 Tax=Haloferax chudinovii TaxID=1109010 RepID=A0ABD5XKQ5_9EURY
MTDDVGADHPGTVASGVDRAAPGDTALLADVMLGKLTTYLRMCGYDAAYALDRGGAAEDSDGARDARADPGDDGLLARADAEERVLLTRDVRLAERAPRSVLLAEREPIAQLRELESVGFAVSLDEEPSRCGVCNGRVEAVDRGESVPDYAPDPAETALWRCRDCGQVFWRGSHWRDVEARLNGEER